MKRSSGWQMLDWQMIALAITHIAYGLIIEHRYNGKNKAATCGELPAFIVLLARKDTTAKDTSP